MISRIKILILTLLQFNSSLYNNNTRIAKFELSVSRLRNAIYFSIIAMPKSHFIFFAIQNFVQNAKKPLEFQLFCWDHTCKDNDWCLVDCFHCEFRISTQIMVHDYSITKCKTFSTCIMFLMAFRVIFSWFKGFALIQTLNRHILWSNTGNSIVKICSQKVWSHF